MTIDRAVSGAGAGLASNRMVEFSPTSAVVVTDSKMLKIG